MESWRLGAIALSTKLHKAWRCLEGRGAASLLHLPLPSSRPSAHLSYGRLQLGHARAQLMASHFVKQLWWMWRMPPLHTAHGAMRQSGPDSAPP